MIHLATERSGVVSFQSFERLYFFKFSNYKKAATTILNKHNGNKTV